MPNNKIVFFGTPNFSLPILAALIAAKHNIVLVVTKPDQPVGRKLILTSTPVKALAEKSGIQICDDLKKLKTSIKTLKPTLGIVVAYGKLIPNEILESFPLGCLNLHPSLLPKYRGSSPIQNTILNGDKETGVTIIKLDKQMDHGPIIGQTKYIINNNDTAQTLHNNLSQAGADLLINILPEYLQGHIKPIPQDEALATFTKIITKEDGQINWAENALVIGRQIRAYYPWPGSFTAVKVKNNKALNVKIIKASISPENFSENIGQWQTKDGQLFVRCRKGSLIIEEVQPEGKKIMTASEFINGYIK